MPPAPRPAPAELITCAASQALPRAASLSLTPPSQDGLPLQHLPYRPSPTLLPLPAVPFAQNAPAPVLNL